MKTLLWLSMSGSVLALMLMLLRKLLGKRLPSVAYYYAWLLVLLRFSLPLPGLIPEKGESASAARAAYETPFPAAAIETEPPLKYDFREVETVPEIHLPKAAEQPYAEVSASAEPQTSRNDRVVLTVWALGFFGLAAWRIYSYLRFRNIIEAGLCKPSKPLEEMYLAIPGRKPELYESAGIRGPLTYGVLSPHIVLPKKKAAETEIRSMLAHELMHYRRKDALYKLFAMLILSAQWFNPVAYAALGEISYACELSCDAMLLSCMNEKQKRAYGDTLLCTAASLLPESGVYNAFYSSKRVLKSRLEQIMSYKNSRNRILSALLLPVMLFVCLAAGPAVRHTAAAQSERTVQVSSVDGLLHAIAPDTHIELAPGDYDLSTASDYGKETESAYYSWFAITDWTDEGALFAGAELRLKDVSNLTICGAGMGETRLLAVPRFANVLSLWNCKNIRLEGLTAGHTTQPGACSGGVVHLQACEDICIDACGLFGCGTIGVQAADCTGVEIKDCGIYECSVAAVDTFSCREVTVSGCDVHSIQASGMPASGLFSAQQGDGFTLYNNFIHDNYAVHLMRMERIANVMFLSNRVEMNILTGPAFLCTKFPAVVAGCAFENNVIEQVWYNDDTAAPVYLSGEQLDEARLENMRFEDIAPDAARLTLKEMYSASEGSTDVPVGAEIHVRDADELLAAIGPRRTVILEDGDYDAAKASSLHGTLYCSFDAGGIVIRDADLLTIRSASDEASKVRIFSSENGVQVLRFENCQELNFLGIYFGGAGDGSGTALSLEECYDVSFFDCIVHSAETGIRLNLCATIRLNGLEMTGCTGKAFASENADGVSFIKCSAHDTASPALSFTATGDKTWNGNPFTGEGEYDVSPKGELVKK